MSHRTAAQGLRAMCLVCLLVAGIAENAVLAAPADFPMQAGELAVTCFGGPYLPGNPNIVLDTQGFVVAVIDARVPPVGGNPSPTTGAHWYPPTFHNEYAPTTPQDVWNARNLGQVFGLTLDGFNPPGIVVTATTVFGDYTAPAYAWPNGGFGPAGYAGVYWLNATTGDITALTATVANGLGGVGTNQIPNEGAGLGNITYDRDNRQLFVTNHEDGRIYRLNLSGIIQSIHDPFGADPGTPGFAPLGERLWAAAYHNGRLYYSVWLRDQARATTPWNPNAGPPPANPNNSIWSIAIDPLTDDFSGPDVLELVVPYISTNPAFSNPVADIAFSDSGHMVLSEKTMAGNFGLLDLGHGARILEYTFSGSWVPTGAQHHIGSTYHAPSGMYANSSGGTDYDCNEGVWSSGDTLIWGPTAYGFQRVPPGGNTVTTPTSTSWIIDGGFGKATFGEVDVFRGECVTAPQTCDVAPGGLECTGDCSDPGALCHPREVLADATGQLLSVTCCACDPAGCLLEVDPVSGQFACTPNPGCPNAPVDECRLVGHGNADGTISYSCECLNPELPTNCAYVEECNANCPGTCVKRCSGVCPDPSEVCLPTVIAKTAPIADDYTIVDCACAQPTSDLCRPAVTPEGVVCHGDCPDPTQECELVVTTAPDGVGQQYHCEPCSVDQEIGACCHLDAVGVYTCTETTATDCAQNLAGIFLGVGTNCSAHGYQCDEFNHVVGACCFIDPPTGMPTCAITTQTICLNDLNGTYLGNGTSCTPDPCPGGEPEGACCAQDAGGNWQCHVTSPAECETELFGNYLGDGTDCDPDPCPQDEGCDCPGNCIDRTPAYDDQAYAPFTDEVAVATEWSQLSTDPVLVNIDIKNRVTAPLNANWTVRTNTRYSHPSWSRNNLGTIFGVALDLRGHTYVTASTTYFLDNVGALSGATWGSVIKVDAATALPTVFANLPNSGPALGNICYDAAGDQFFVSNFEDGRIYRLSSTGACLGTFDHATGIISPSCAPEVGDSNGFAPLGERVWGLQTYNGRLYYGIWAEDVGRPSAALANTIHSIALAGGNFSGAASLEIVLPPLPGFGGTPHSNPPADIAFSEIGCMLIAERGMSSDEFPSPHSARVLEYRETLGGTWWPSAATFAIGAAGSANAAGGVDYDREGNVWATGDALQFTPLAIYGLQSLPCTGGDVTSSVLVDLNGIYLTTDKTDIGDVEVACAQHCVTPPKAMVAWFPFDEPAGAAIAQEIVWDRDGVYVGTITLPGMVGPARRFNGAGDHVRVPNAAQHNFGAGDFSVDAWVRCPAGTGLQVIADKRVSPARGWSLFLLNGELGFQLADGAGFSNYIRPGVITDGQWHHVAATVDRDDPAGLVLYVDGVGTAFNPTARSGSVSNSSDLWIGVRAPAFGQVFYRGDIDEFELFRRALDVGEVQALFAAGKSGKCKDRCHLPRLVPLCKNKNSVVVNLTICNDSPAPHNYLYFMFGNNSCTWPGPTTFTPFVGIVNVPAGGCVTVPITVTRPTGMSSGFVSCFNVSIWNLDTGHNFGCEGSIKTTNTWCIIIVVADPIGVPIGLPKSLGFVVTNEGDAPDTFNYTIIAEPDHMDTSGPVTVSLNALPPGEPVVGSLAIDPGVDRAVDFTVGFTQFDAFRAYDVTVLAEEGASRALAELATMTVYPVLPCGDFDRDGVIGAGDAAVFEQCLGGPDVAPQLVCPQTVDADCDDDTDVDLLDFAWLQKIFGTVIFAEE